MVDTDEEEKPHVPVMSQQQEKIYPELMTESSASFDQPSSNNTKEDNKSKTKVEIKGILTVIGGFIVCLSFGSDFSYPNLNTYMTSYLRQNGHNPCQLYSSFIYLVAVKTVLQGFSMPFLGGLASKMGPRISILMGSGLYSFGYMMTYFSITSHFAAAIFTLSLHGIAFCFVYASAIKAAQSWFPETKRGLIASIVVSGYGFGSCLWTPIQTQYVNPNNLKAQIDVNNTDCEQIGKSKFFLDEEILDNVPSMFLMLGIVYAVMGGLSSFLISENKPDVEKEEEKQIVDEDSNSIKPLKVFKLKWFYQTWIGFFSISICMVTVGTISKAFGLTFINDDHFFSYVAIFQNILNGSSRIVWGALYDRFKFKKCFTAIALIATVFMITIIFLPYLGDTTLGRAAYTVWLCVLNSTLPGVYVIVAAEILHAFGRGHYEAIFGLYYSHYLLLMAVNLILKATKIGYYVFCVAGAMALIGLIVVLFQKRGLSFDENKKPESKSTETKV